MSGDYRSHDELTEAMRDGASILRNAEIPFMLIGGMAAWAWGAATSSHDVDFGLTRTSAEDALEAFAVAGWRVEIPPEPWLFKVWRGEVFIDLIFEIAGQPVTTA